MINSHEITEFFLEEVRAYAGRMNYGPESSLTLDEKLERSFAYFPLPDAQQIVSVIEEVFWASLLTEEGRPCRPRLLYIPRQESTRRAVQQLTQALPLTRDTLRKLTPAQGPLGYLTWDCAPDGAEVTGIQGREGGDPCNFTVAAPMNGALDISWNCTRLLALRTGRIERLSRNLKPEVYGALRIVGNLVGGFEPVFLGQTIRAIANGGHGGALWILRKDISHTGINIKYPLRQDDQPLPDQPVERFKVLESIGYLSAVDGAVVINQHIQVFGFGAFIDIPDTPKMINSISDDNKEQSIPSTQLGGGRHRSAVEFCARFAPAAAIVVSEDGRISVLWSINADTLFCAPLAVLGITDMLV